MPVPDVDLNDLAVFVRVVDRGGFARAARELGVPTSTVSRTVARLESLVGARLLHRTTRAVTTTSDGRELYDRVAAPLGALQSVARGIEPTGAEPRGRLRVTAPNDLGSTFLAGVVVAFSERYVHVDVELVLTNRRVSLVEEGIDVAIRVGTLVDSSLIARRVGDVETCLYAAPSYLERHGTPARVDDLVRHHLVLFRARRGRATWTLQSGSREVSIDVEGRVSGDDFTFVRGAVLAGGGIGLLPRLVGVHDESTGRVVRVLPGWEMRGAPLHVVYASAQHVPSRVAAFRDFLIEAFAHATGAPPPRRGRRI